MMRKKLAFLVLIVFFVQLFGSFSVIGNEEVSELPTIQTTPQGPDGMTVETENVISTDFKTNVPPQFEKYVTKIDGENMFSINSNSKVTASDRTGTFGPNCYIETDFKLLSTTAATSGAVSITPYDRGAQTNRTLRFAYIFSVPLNQETRMGSDGDLVTDRIAIVDTGSYNVNKWRFVKISDKPLGILKKKETSWVKFRIVLYNDIYYFSVYDDKGNLLDSLSATKEEVFGDDKDNIRSAGSLQVTLNSTEAAFDNLYCGNIEVIDDLKLKFETKTAKVGTPVKYYFEDANGNKLNLDGAEPIVDGVDTVIAEKNSVIFNNTGKQEFFVNVKDISTGKHKEVQTGIDILNDISFKSLEIIPQSTNVYKNSSVEIRVNGIDEIGDRFEISPGEYEIVSPITDNKDGTIYVNQEGVQRIKVNRNGVYGETDIYVSRYESLTPKLTSGIVEQKSSVSYSLFANEGSGDKELHYSDYKVVADKEGIIISPDGTITASQIGIYKLSFTVDNVSEEIVLNVIERQQGVLINENFDTPGDGQYFTYRPEKMVYDNGNKVFRLENEETEFYGGEAWKAYTISAKVKITKPVIDERCLYSTFEITPLKKHNTTMGFVGGEGGIQCIYRINHNIVSGAHMRISASVGPQINIEDGEYHDFKVDVYENQVIFSIDGIKEYYYQSRNMTGYFTFTANNCEVYIDDLVVVRNLHSERKERSGISPEEEIVRVNPYEPVQFRAINAYRLNYTDGTHNYVTNMGTYSLHGKNEGILWFEAVDGNEYCKVRNGYTLVFNKDVPKDTEVTIKAHLNDFECVFKVIASPPDMSYQDYVKNTVDLRKESYTFRLIKGWGNGIDNSVSSRSTLPHRMAVMTVYPKIYNYDEVFRWYAKATHYEEVYVGRGTDAGDFILEQGMATYMTLKGIANVSDEAWEEWKQFILNYCWEYPENSNTENHRGIYYATAVMAGETFPDDIMYDGKTGKETFDEQRKYLTDWFNYIYTHGQGEYDSGEYYNVDLFNSELLYNSIKNEEIKKAAYDYMTFLYADMLPEQIGGKLTGAHLRSYHKPDMSHMNALAIYFNLSDYMIDDGYKNNVQEVPYSMSRYMPDDVLYDIAFDTERTEEITERHYLYILCHDPLHKDSIVKYTYRTPEYSVGTRVFSDEFIGNPDYNMSSASQVYLSKTFTTELIGNQQGYMWSVTLGNDRDAEITENHPGHYEFYGDGQWVCDCGKYYQYKGASIGMHKIVDLFGQKQEKCSHFYIPSNLIDTVEEDSGWVFINHEDIYVAIKPLKDGKTEGSLYEWGSPDQLYNSIPKSECELRINSSNTAFVSEVTSKTEFGGTFDEFKAKVIANGSNIIYSVDKNDYYLEYTGIGGTKIKIDYNKNKRYLNGKEVDFTHTKLFDSKYVDAEWGSGEININTGNNTYSIKPVKYFIDTATAWILINKIDKLTQEFEYEAKFGRGTNWIETHKAELIEMTEIPKKYNNSFFYDIVYKRLRILSENIVKFYSDSSVLNRSKLEEIVNMIQANIYGK